MKLWKTTGKIAGHIVDIRADRWVGLDYLKNTTRYFWSALTQLTTKQKPRHEESFEQAMERLNLTSEDLVRQEQTHLRLALFFTAVTLALFLYSLYILFSFHNFYGLFMGLGLTLYAATLAFRHHLWVCQIRQRKLGLSFSDWLMHIRGKTDEA